MIRELRKSTTKLIFSCFGSVRPMGMRVYRLFSILVISVPKRRNPSLYLTKMGGDKFVPSKNIEGTNLSPGTISTFVFWLK